MIRYLFEIKKGPISYPLHRILGCKHPSLPVLAQVLLTLLIFIGLAPESTTFYALLTPSSMWGRCNQLLPSLLNTISLEERGGSTPFGQIPIRRPLLGVYPRDLSCRLFKSHISDATTSWTPFGGRSDEFNDHGRSLPPLFGGSSFDWRFCLCKGRIATLGGPCCNF